ncbi:Delta(24)-sterol C-methyltransferase [Cladophialophora chaetospira]|uniref:Sterol 24-C-methyltransferase n=1 Tax=Cladophialophora chaetospira TaxID=386627 RepID=A0AA38XD84_9EURO|nr:Delta(24)-sterol C-methyltransferase [Cladophialophora chaetospira]
MAPSAVSTVATLEQEDHARDAAFYKALHGKSVEARGGLAAMRNKDKEAQKAAVDEYFKHWDNKDAATETEEVRKARRDEYATLTRHYYNLATDLYEYGWGTSFHFCRFAYGESFRKAIARHEHYLALKMGIQDEARVLDVGCGVGGPAREMIKFTGANIVGLNNNDYQIERSLRYAKKEGIAEKWGAVKGDFMQMSFPENSFDAVYAIEATVHAPSLQGVYEQIFKVLKPGGVFGVYEWLMTDNYDNNNPAHREIRLGIEQGNGISNMVRVSEGLAAIKAAGFDLEFHEDLAERPDAIPWYWPLAGDWKYLGSIIDLFTIGRMTWWGRGLIHRFIGLGETLKVMPKGTQKTADSLALAADCLVAGGKQKLFTPMYLMVARKPKA